MRSILRRSVFTSVCAFMLFLSGCASIAPMQVAPEHVDPALQKAAEERLLTHAQLQQWNLRGTLALHEADRYTSARMQWQQQNPSALELRVQGGLGAGALRLAVRADESVLWVEGEEIHAATPEALLQQRLGLRWPISNMQDWIRAIPRKDVAVLNRRIDAHGDLVMFEQSGWRIEVIQRDEASGLPKRLRLMPLDEATELVLEFAGLRWQLNPAEPSK
jgi:outer membrane lipoprotein LolB